LWRAVVGSDGSGTPQARSTQLADGLADAFRMQRGLPGAAAQLIRIGMIT
jgi:hypothetical protein